MDPERARIFRLIETADNFIKYAPAGHEERADERARARYERAGELARIKGDQTLIEQIEVRMHDLERRAAATDQNNGGARERVRPVEQPATKGVAASGDSLPHSLMDPTTPFSEAEVVVASPPAHAVRRVPPGQRVTRGWPVLHEGPIPAFDPQLWRLAITGACREPFQVTYTELQQLPNVEVHSDFHCVTGWSKLDNVWRGVQARVLLDKAFPTPDASHVLVHAEHGYAANLPLQTLMGSDAVFVWAHNGQELAPEHGFPLRLLVPGLYGWKSVKWVQTVELLTHDNRGYWETRGYHNHADPWREERYSYQEA
jgi:DMSO/TMAO reductase YedYZ molybdopterin-dependent catalytic subunit